MYMYIYITCTLTCTLYISYVCFYDMYLAHDVHDMYLICTCAHKICTCTCTYLMCASTYKIHIMYIMCKQCFPQGLTTGGAGGCGLGVVNVHIKAFHANLNTHQRISINLSRVAHPAKRLWGKHCVQDTYHVHIRYVHVHILCAQVHIRYISCTSCARYISCTYKICTCTYLMCASTYKIHIMYIMCKIHIIYI